MNLDDLAQMLGKTIMTTPPQQVGLSQQLPTESANEDQQLMQLQPPGSSDVFNRTDPAEGNADNLAHSNSWPVQGSSEPTDDYSNMAAHMAILMHMMQGKVPTPDAINAPYGSNMRSSPQ